MCRILVSLFILTVISTYYRVDGQGNPAKKFIIIDPPQKPPIVGSYSFDPITDEFDIKGAKNKTNEKSSSGKDRIHTKLIPPFGQRGTTEQPHKKVEPAEEDKPENNETNPDHENEANPTEPATAPPENAAPEAAAPEVAAPEAAAPEAAAPEAAEPETAAPETAAPETEALETAAPETAAPEITTPEPEPEQEATTAAAEEEK